jgi:hypothetical protein
MICSFFNFTPTHGKIQINKMPFPVLQFLKVQPELLDTMKKSSHTIQGCSTLWCFPEYDPDGLTSRRASFQNN